MEDDDIVVQLLNRNERGMDIDGENNEIVLREELRGAPSSSVTLSKGLFSYETNVSDINRDTGSNYYALQKVNNKVNMDFIDTLTLNFTENVSNYTWDLVSNFINNSTLNPNNKQPIGIRKIKANVSVPSSQPNLQSSYYESYREYQTGGGSLLLTLNAGSGYNGFSSPLTVEIEEFDVRYAIRSLYYKKPNSTSGTATTDCYINFKTGTDSGQNYYMTRTTGTAGSNKAISIPANKVLFAITKGGDSYHLYAAYNNTSSAKSVNIKLPSSSGVCYYTTTVKLRLISYIL